MYTAYMYQLYTCILHICIYVRVCDCIRSLDSVTIRSMSFFSLRRKGVFIFLNLMDWIIFSISSSNPADLRQNYQHLQARNTCVQRASQEHNITKSYKISQPTTIQTIQAQDNAITSKLGIDNRVDITAKKEALKDHKPNFESRPICRLLNPTKSEIGQVSKKILDRINKKILSSTNINQWKNTKSVTDWFRNIKNKQQHSFICFDIVDFYPSIRRGLLSRALSFSSNFDDICSNSQDRDFLPA